MLKRILSAFLLCLCVSPVWAGRFDRISLFGYTDAVSDSVSVGGNKYAHCSGKGEGYWQVGAAAKGVDLYVLNEGSWKVYHCDGSKWSGGQDVPDCTMECGKEINVFDGDDEKVPSLYMIYEKKDVEVKSFNDGIIFTKEKGVLCKSLTSKDEKGGIHDCPSGEIFDNATECERKCISNVWAWDIKKCSSGYRLQDMDIYNDGMTVKKCLLEEAKPDSKCKDGARQEKVSCDGKLLTVGLENCNSYCRDGQWHYLAGECKSGYMPSFTDKSEKVCTECTSQKQKFSNEESQDCWGALNKTFKLSDVKSGCSSEYCQFQRELLKFESEIQTKFKGCGVVFERKCNVKKKGPKQEAPYYMQNWYQYDGNENVGYSYVITLTPTGCKDGYDLRDDRCVESEVAQSADGGVVNVEQSSVDKCIASRTTDEGKACCRLKEYYAKWENEKCVCVDEKLVFKLLENVTGTCVPRQSDNTVEAQGSVYEQPLKETPAKPINLDGTPCRSDDRNAKSAKWQSGKCVIDACNEGYELKSNECVVISGPCETLPQNAKTAHRVWDAKTKSVVCIIDECKESYYKVSDDKKSCVEDKKAKSQAKIDELQENADAMKEKEQSTANKLLGGVAIGATGIGAMQAASAYSEQQADEEAEQAMKAYLATFHCNYGGGKNVPGGEKDVQLPGGNELIDLYAEYVNLANNLKVRKAALDLRPGIESEPILDSATSGLYDDVAIGKTSGAFTSLARALMDPNGADAAAWAAQKDDSAQKMKTGLTTAGIGAAGSAVGNLLINKDAPKENSKEIIGKYKDGPKVDGAEKGDK